MTKEDFKKLPYLVMEHDIVACGLGRATIGKYVENGILARVCPAGAGQAKYRKKQLAQLLQWEGLLEPELFRREKPLLEAKAVTRWTGWSDTTLGKIVQARGLTFVKPPGAGKGKYLKQQIAVLIGMEEQV